MSNADDFMKDYTIGCLAFLSVAIAKQGSKETPEEVLEQIVADVTEKNGPVEFYENMLPVLRAVCQYVLENTEDME